MPSEQASRRPCAAGLCSGSPEQSAADEVRAHRRGWTAAHTARALRAAESTTNATYEGAKDEKKCRTAEWQEARGGVTSGGDCDSGNVVGAARQGGQRGLSDE